MKLVKVKLVSDSKRAKGEVGHALQVFNCVKDAARAARQAGIGDHSIQEYDQQVEVAQ